MRTAHIKRSLSTRSGDGSGSEQLIDPRKGYNINWKILLVTNALNNVRPRVLR